MKLFKKSSYLLRLTECYTVEHLLGLLFRLLFFSWGETESASYCGHWLACVPAPDDDDDCGAISGMRNGRGNRITRRKPTPVPLRPPQIPQDLTRARTRAATMGIRRLTA
jgi:hypothetical protein